MEVLLRELKPVEDDDVYAFFQSIPAEEKGFTNPAYGLNREEFNGFTKKRVERSKWATTDEIVPDTMYLLYIDGKCVGVGKLRHCLNEKLRKVGGHIGYGIAPDFRGNGFANIILASILVKAKEMGIDKVMLTSNDDNPGSYKTIEKNGGVLERAEGGHRHYWIDLND